MGHLATVRRPIGRRFAPLARATALMLALAAAAGVGGAALAAPQCDLAATETIVVAEALDGGVLRATGGMAVRLAGIETPQQPPDEKDASPAAGSAAAALRRLAGATVRLAPTGPPDRYGRVHAQLFLADGRWLQAELVAAGLARIRADGNKKACIAALLEVERAAREARLGLWAEPDYAVRKADDPSLSERNSLYELVEGRVVSIGYGSRMVFLDFGRNYRTDFTVLVPKPVVPRFAEAGLPIDSLRGRSIRVRGVIEESGGPAIRIADPIEVELLDGGK
jgi:endonuclease YncB( thermonuclease family)